jgi:hypothetical protein
VLISVTLISVTDFGDGAQFDVVGARRLIPRAISGGCFDVERPLGIWGQEQHSPLQTS